MLFPKQTKYKKQFKGKFSNKNQTIKGNRIKFGKYAIKALEETRLTSYQIESARRTIVRKMQKLGFLWTRVFPDIPVTSKPIENRMGKGKGAVSFWVAKIKKGQVLYEISGTSLENAEKILQSGSQKLSIRTKFIFK